MSTVSLSTALSGMSAANERLRASANNIANVATPGYHRERIEAETAADGNGVTTDLVEQKSATYAYVANLRVLQTQLRAEGALLDIHV